MLNTQLHPTSMVGIKRYANQLKKLNGISHPEALDMASQAAGFQNFRHAQKSFNKLGNFRNSVSLQSGYTVYISAFWKDKSTGTSGQELLSFKLSVNLGELVKPEAFYAFRNSGPDHIEYKYTEPSQVKARETICKACRALHFMDATKLRPSTAFIKAYPGGSYDNEIPGHDHASVWYDRKTKRYVYVDEPYDEAVKHDEIRRTAWSRRHGQVIRKSKWRGIYYPEMCHMFLISPLVNGVPLDPIINALDALPPPMTTDLWDGETIPFLPPFISPGAIAKERVRKEKPRPKPATGPLKTVEYNLALTGLKRRPKIKVSLEIHKEIGGKISLILAHTYERKGVYNPLNSVRCELDNWVQCEYPREDELSMKDFNDLYYPSNGPLVVTKYDEQLKAKHFQTLKEINELLTNHYPDCDPLRKLTRLITRAESSLREWKT